MTDKLRIKKTNTCAHKILPKHCSSCQIQTFLLCLKEKKIHILNDLKKLLFSFVRKEQEAYIVDLRYAQNNEASDYPNVKDHGLCNGLMPIGVPYSQTDEHMEKLRIVFIGSKESYYGFFCCLLIKYMTTTFAHSVNQVIEFDIDENIARVIGERCYLDDNIISRIFDLNPNIKSYITVKMDVWNQYLHLTTNNAFEFFRGYQKMLELDIKEVFSRAQCSGTISFRSGVEHFKWHDSCPTIKTCTAYWYYLD